MLFTEGIYMMAIYLSDIKLADRYGVDRSTIWRWAGKDKFPQPFKLNGTTRWKLSDVEEWEQLQENFISH